MLRSRFDGNDRSGLSTNCPDQDVLGGSGTASMIGRVVSPSASIAVGKFLKGNPATALGPETEGAAGAINVDTSVVIPGHFEVMNGLVGVPGNNCIPFSLANGATSNATFQAQGISIDGRGLF